MALTLNPRWHTPGASLWCLAAKVAFATTCALAPVLWLWVRAAATFRLPIWACAADQRASLANDLQIFDLNAIDAMFIGEEPTQLGERQHISLQLRWCPTCARDWYHTAKFQDTRVRYCPWHSCALLEGCPKCGRPVDPLAGVWRCSQCDHELAPEPVDWLSVFKRLPEKVGAWPPTVDEAQVGYDDASDGVRCFADSENHVLDKDWAQLYWAQGQVFESACALWDTVLRNHKFCAQEEGRGHMPQYFERSFKCPTTAAAGSVFGELGACCEAGGEWPKQALAVADHMGLPGFQAISHETLRGLLRELPRAWLLDALMVYGDYVKAGRRQGRWEPPKLRLKDLVGNSPNSPVELLHLLRTEVLVSATGYASAGCTHARVSSFDVTPLIELHTYRHLGRN